MIINNIRVEKIRVEKEISTRPERIGSLISPYLSYLCRHFIPLECLHINY